MMQSFDSNISSTPLSWRKNSKSHKTKTHQTYENFKSTKKSRNRSSLFSSFSSTNINSTSTPLVKEVGIRSDQLFTPVIVRDETTRCDISPDVRYTSYDKLKKIQKWRREDNGGNSGNSGGNNLHGDSAKKINLFESFKTRHRDWQNRCGACIISADRKTCLLVKQRESQKWSFPKGFCGT